MSKRRKKMTGEDLIKLTMLNNFGAVFNRKWGAPKCSACQACVDQGRDALINLYMSKTPEERDPLGTGEVMGNPEAYASVAAAVWLIDMIREMEMELLPTCPSCGYKPANQFAAQDDEAAP